MSISTKLILFTFFVINMSSKAQHLMHNNLFSWQQFDSIPDADGFAGSYAGVSNNSLIVAGGSNFPGNKRPWTNGVKTWHDNIFVLENAGSKWKKIGKLPRPMGYGVSVTYNDGMVCLGGGDALHNYSDVFSIKYINGTIETQILPSMPAPMINACGTIINNIIYITGGIRTPTGMTENEFWCLDMKAAEKKWKILEPFPGNSRMLATAGTNNGSFFVFGGVHLVYKDSIMHREYLKDCWKYKIGIGWIRIADLPHAIAAAPSPAFNQGQNNLLFFGGDEGKDASRVAELKDQHPGFRDEVLAYNVITDSWSVMGKMPVNKKPDAVVNPHESIYAPVTTPLVVWNGKVIIPGGEARPAVRTNKVLVATLN
jgi:N-acetylneuraminic acid mutarotase